MIIKIDDNRYIKFDEDSNRSVVLLKSELIETKERIENDISLLPSKMSDNDLLKWAKKEKDSESNKKKLNELENELELVNQDLIQME